MGCCASSTAAKSAQDTKQQSKTLMKLTPDCKPAEKASVPATSPAADVVKMLNEVFDRIDVNKDGAISRQELSASLDNLLDCSHVESMKSVRTLVAESGLNPFFNTFDELDTNHDGKISREEFQAQMHPSKASKTVEKMLKEVFDRIDANGDGNLSRKELATAFETFLTCSCIQSQKNIKALMVDAGMNPDFFVFEQLDANSDGKVTWEEFRTRLQPAVDIMEFLKTVFGQLDANQDGQVSREELAASFEQVLDCSHVQTKKSFRQLVAEAGLNPKFYVFEQLDTNKDGRITWEEFEANLRASPPAEATQDGESPADNALQDILPSTELAPPADSIVVEEVSGSTTRCCI